MPTRKNLRHRIKARKEGAALRVLENHSRSYEERIENLTEEGHGHCKEVGKLRRLIVERDSG